MSRRAPLSAYRALGYWLAWVAVTVTGTVVGSLGLSFPPYLRGETSVATFALLVPTGSATVFVASALQVVVSRWATGLTLWWALRGTLASLLAGLPVVALTAFLVISPLSIPGAAGIGGALIGAAIGAAQRAELRKAAR